MLIIVKGLTKLWISSNSIFQNEQKEKLIIIDLLFFSVIHFGKKASANLDFILKHCVKTDGSIDKRFIKEFNETLNEGYDIGYQQAEKEHDEELERLQRLIMTQENIISDLRETQDTLKSENKTLVETVKGLMIVESK